MYRCLTFKACNKATYINIIERRSVYYATALLLFHKYELMFIFVPNTSTQR